MMNQPRLPPGVTPAQVKTAGECPMKCNPDPTLRAVNAQAHPGPGGVVSRLYSRCGYCLAYWETDTSGKILKLSRPVIHELCPDCHLPYAGSEVSVMSGAPGGKNLCKNSGHVVSKLVGP